MDGGGGGGYIMVSIATLACHLAARIHEEKEWLAMEVMFTSVNFGVYSPVQ